MRKLFWLSCLLIGIPTILSASTSVLTGKIDDSSQPISITFPTDFISGNSITFPIEVLEDGSYKIGIVVTHPIAGILNIGPTAHRLFIHPRDSVHLNIRTGTDPFQVNYSGRHASENQFLNSIAEGDLSEEEVIYAMSTMEVDAYKTWLTERYLQKKARYIQERSQGVWSSDFEVFMNSELDYQYAYFLLRYRIEYPIGNDLVPPLALPNDYLSTLSGIVVNNSKGLNSPAYRKFLPEYVGLINEVDENERLLLKEENFLVNSKSSPLFAQPDVPPIYQTLNAGEMVKYLGDRSDFKTKSRIGGEIAEDYWYKVKLDNGRNGWLLGHTVDQISKTASTYESPIKQEVTTISKVVTKAVAIYDNLEVFNDPHQRKVIRRLGYGFEMDYPHVSTTENMSYKFQGVNRLGKFVMVDIDGEIGWVFEQGIRTQKTVVESKKHRKIVTLAALKDYSQLGSILSGNALYYYIAKDLYNRMQYAPDDNLNQDIQNFLSISTDTMINQFVQYHQTEMFGTGLSFDLKMEDIQLVRFDPAYSQSTSEGIIASSKVLDIDYEVYENYVALSLPREETNQIETRITLSNTNQLSVSMISDPLTGRTTRLGGYSSGNSLATLAYDQADNEWAVLNYNGLLTPLYLEAGTDIQISVDGAGALRFGEDDVVNAFLYDFHNAFKKRGQSITQKVRSLDESDFKVYITGLAKQKMAYVNAKADDLDLDPQFVKDITDDINYWMGYQLLRYTQEHPKYDKSWTLPDEAKNYYDFLSSININPVGSTLGTNYRGFISAYLRYEHGKIENRNTDIKAFIESKFNGYSYYYLMAQELYADVFSGDPIHVGKAIAEFMQRNPYPKLNQSLVKVYEANLPLRAGVTAPYFELKDRSGRLVKQTDLIGKIVILDFWATWCAPCLEKIRSDQRITSKYSEDEVVFLYVSLDNNKSTWTNFLNGNPTLKGIHAIPFDQAIAFDSSIAQAYKVSSIPAFYIIGKDGNLAYNPFTTLSPNRIRDHIDNLLNPR